jgi:DNA repair protein RadC
MTSRKFSTIPSYDRPREKMQRKGADALSDFELLEVLIGSGNQTSDVSQIARQVHKLLSKNAHNLSLEALTNIHGISTATATKLLACLELARRYLVQDLEPILSETDLLARLHDIRPKQQEYLICLSLDGGNRLIAQRTITVGTLDTLLTHPREVFADALTDRAASIIISHNHPSGDPQPSAQDITLTQQLVATGQLVGIPLRDHLIVTKNAHFSFKQNHML